MAITKKIIILSIFAWAFICYSLFVANYAYAAEYFIDNDTAGCVDFPNNTYSPSARSCGSGNDIIYDSIQKAVIVLKPGDTAMIREGTYAEYVEIGTGAGGLARDGEINNPITIKSFENENVVVNFKDEYKDFMIKVVSKKYWIFDGLTFSSTRPFNLNTPAWEHVLLLLQGGGNYVVRNSNFLGNDIDHLKSGWALGLHYGANNVKIENNFFWGFYCSSDDCDISGVVMTGSMNSDIEIINNEFEGLSGDGIHVIKDSAKNLLIRGNTFKNKYGEYEENAIDFKNVINATIRNNIISGYIGKVTSPQGSCIVIANGTQLDNLVIEDNVIHDCGEGIVIAPGRAPYGPARISGNLIYNIHKGEIGKTGVRGGTGWGLRVHNLNDASIYHNTIANTEAAGIMLYTRVDNVRINNNVLYNNNLGIYDFENNLPDKKRVLIGTNDIFDSGIGGEKVRYKNSSGNFITYNVSELQSNLSQGNGSINSNPLFNNPSIDELADYHLQPASPAIDKGELIPGINDDFTGMAPDIGAYEYQGDVYGSADVNRDGNINIKDI